MTRAVLFDLDGTLVDSAPDIHAAANAVLTERGIAPLTLAEARGFVGHGAEIFIDRCLMARGLAGDPDLKARLLTRFLELYEHAVELSAPYPGVRDALEDLAARGVRLGVCTNKPQGPARAVLGHLDLEGFFEVIVGGDSLAVRKPDPAPLRAAVSALHGRQVVFVGDSEVDAETALRADLPFALFTEGYRKLPVDELTHAVAFAEFSALPALLRPLLD